MKLIDKPNNLMWKEINRINRYRSATRLWNHRNRNNLIYRVKKKESNKLHYKKNKISYSRKLRRFIDSKKYYNPIINNCKHCNQIFLSIQGKNQLFCNNKHKQIYFYNLNKANGMNRFYKKTRRAREHNHKHLFTHQQWKQKLIKSQGLCLNCDNFIGINKLTLDHIIPLSKAPVNFEYTIDDVQPLCLKCNQQKNNRI